MDGVVCDRMRGGNYMDRPALYEIHLNYKSRGWSTWVHRLLQDHSVRHWADTRHGIYSMAFCSVPFLRVSVSISASEGRHFGSEVKYKAEMLPNSTNLNADPLLAWTKTHSIMSTRGRSSIITRGSRSRRQLWTAKSSNAWRCWNSKF